MSMSKTDIENKIIEWAEPLEWTLPKEEREEAGTCGSCTACQGREADFFDQMKRISIDNKRFILLNESQCYLPRVYLLVGEEKVRIRDLTWKEIRDLLPSIKMAIKSQLGEQNSCKEEAEKMASSF